MIAIEMLVAIRKVSWRNGFWAAERGYGWSLMLLVVAVTLGIAGPGRYALDPAFQPTVRGHGVPRRGARGPAAHAARAARAVNARAGRAEAARVATRARRDRSSTRWKPGKTRDGLIDALEKAAFASIAKALEGGKITPEQAEKLRTAVNAR